MDSSDIDKVDSMSLPHPAEYVSVRHALAQDCGTLRLIDQDIDAYRMRLAHVHAQLCLLELERDAVQRRVANYRTRLSPLRAVPDQVLQEIFWHCLPDTTYVVPETRSAPLLLTQVCRRWRAVAHGTSELWSSIALYDLGVWNHELDVEMAKQWLARCRGRPLRMSIACAPCTDVGLNEDVPCSGMFQLAIAYSTQLSDLCLHVNKSYFYELVARARLPSLRTLIISLNSAHHNDSPVELSATAMVSASNLRHLACYGNGASVDLVPSTLYSDITHLALNCPMTLDFALLFQDFVRLERLSLTLTLSRDALRIQVPLPQPTNTKVFVVSKSLQHLSIVLDKDMLDFGDPEELEAVLGPLSLPGLHTLSITAPLGVLDARTKLEEEAGWDKYMSWVRNPSVVALLKRSRHPQGARLECRDLAAASVW